MSISLSMMIGLLEAKILIAMITVLLETDSKHLSKRFRVKNVSV
jgi:hypothetical protein